MSIKKIGKYTVQTQLGTGAHSTILRITRHEDGRQYALKIVTFGSKEDKKFLDQAEHEFRIAQMLEHPNLIKVFAFETQSDWMFRVRKVMLLIELVNGQTLDKLKSFSVKRLAPIFVQVASGLVHMHRRGVCHADLKPGNIIFSPHSGQAKVIDFGLARIKDQRRGRVQGTPEYMAPETVVHGVVSEKTDIFNFGATMYRLVTFKLPPSTVPAPGAPLLNAKAYAHMLEDVAEINPSVPAELAELIRRCLEFNPDQRPERISEVQGILDRIADKLGPPDEQEEYG